MDKRMLYLTKEEHRIFGGIVDCCINTAVGKDRLRNPYKKVVDYFTAKKEKVNTSMIYCLIKLLVTAGVLKKAFKEPLQGEKKAASTYEIVRDVFDRINIKIVKKRSSQMMIEMGLRTRKRGREKPGANHAEPDIEFIARAREVLESKQREVDALLRQAEIIKSEMGEIAQNLENYKASRTFLIKL